jgi:hypothetical protein
MIVYNPTRLEWHLGDETVIVQTPQISVVGLVKASSEAFVAVSIALLLLTPRAKTNQSYLRGFSFGQCNAERRWLHLRHPETRASQSREGGRISRAWRLKQVWNSAFAMTWLHTKEHC